jgi:glycosyltransferase involved in cell wall biosynthesis
MSPTTDLTIAILCRNAAKTLESAIRSVQDLGLVVMLDDHSTDNSVKIAKSLGALVIDAKPGSFAQKRNQLLYQANTSWVFYLDADERVTPELATEICQITNSDVSAVYKVTRTNYFLGTKMYTDQVDRLFHCSLLKKWIGAVHESPVTEGESKTLKYPLLHFTHTDIGTMLEKTNQWSDIEADLRIKAKHPPVAWWRLMRIAITESINQFIKKNILQYKRPGLFEGYFQVIDKLIVYTKLWERQQKT